MTVRLGVLAFVSAVVLSSVPARADTIDVATIAACVGNPTCVTANGTVSAIGGNLSSQTLNTWTGIGVSGGAVNGEIDGSSEAIEIDFGKSVNLTSVQLIFLYEPPAWDDAEYLPGDDESATIEAFNGSTSLGTASFFVTGTSSASTTSGSWSLLSSAAQSGGGAWSWTSPFAFPLTKIRFYSADPGPDNTYSDFAIGDTVFETRREVSEPLSALLLALGGALVARRRASRRTAARA